MQQACRYLYYLGRIRAVQVGSCVCVLVMWEGWERLGAGLHGYLAASTTWGASARCRWVRVGWECVGRQLVAGWEGEGRAGLKGYLVAPTTWGRTRAVQVDRLVVGWEVGAQFGGCGLLKAWDGEGL